MKGVGEKVTVQEPLGIRNFNIVSRFCNCFVSNVYRMRERVVSGDKDPSRLAPIQHTLEFCIRLIKLYNNSHYNVFEKLIEYLAAFHRLKLSALTYVAVIKYSSNITVCMVPLFHETSELSREFLNDQLKVGFVTLEAFYTNS